MIARVALPIPRAEPFDYQVPLGMSVEIGHRVRVPLGKRRLWGVVVELVPEDRAGLLPLEEVGEALVPAAALPLFRQVADGAFVSLGFALHRLVPPPARSRARVYRLTVPPSRAQALAEELSPRAPAQARALRALLAGDTRELEGKGAALSALAQKGLVRPEALPFSFSLREPRREVCLTPHQEEALRRLAGAEPGQAFLLFGPPGAGKTVVFLRAAQATLAAGRAVLFLEPEVSLLPQLWARAAAALDEEVALYFGELPPGERWRVWDGARAGRLRVACGTRSAVFLPFPSLGLVVLDEEGEPAYKQEEMAPHYHARQVAEFRARREGAVVLLGAAAPQVETFYRAQQGSLELLSLPERVAGTPPQVQVVPQGEEVLSPELQAALDRHLARGGQALLFINRRGFFTGAACRSCGTLLRCPGCGVPLVFHLPRQAFLCHVCGRAFPRPSCPTCGGDGLRLFGLGSQRVEFEVQRLFPSLSVARLDTDTARQRGEILAALARGEIDVLVGTQMVGKGLDFPRITLVGVIDADALLAIPDFRTGERAFQLLLAAAGRAGRGPWPGEVIVQTNQPQHYAIQHALAGDYLAFYEQELTFRQALSYPPFSRLVQLVAVGKRARERAEALLPRLEKLAAEVLGPSELYPRGGVPRWQLVVKGDQEVVARLREVLLPLPPWLQVNPDPYHLL